MTNLIELLKSNPDLANAVVAAMALTVSFISIVLTVATLYLTRQHNHKSLTPIASIPLSDYESKIAVKIKNTGVGPLIIHRASSFQGKRTPILRPCPLLGPPGTAESHDTPDRSSNWDAVSALQVVIQGHSPEAL